MHKKFVAPPDLNSRYDTIPDTLEKSIENILLSEDDFTKIERMPSGTICTTRKSATPEEIASAKAEKIRRRKSSNLAAGSADIDGSYEPGLELVSEPRPAFQAPSDGTTRTDR